MNLHEECLLKYLQNTSGLSATTEFLKQANELIGKQKNPVNILAKVAKVGYITNRY